MRVHLLIVASALILFGENAYSQQVIGAIADKWRALGGESGPLGKPLTNELDANRGGKYNNFEHGMIYWLPGLGANAVYGAIGEKYSLLGRERGALGYPLSDEGPADRGGRFNNFQSGMIYWHPQLGANAVYGRIGEKWIQAGRERGELGYPTSDEFQEGALRRSNFEHGFILWSDAGGAIIYTGTRSAGCDAYAKAAVAQSLEYFSRRCGGPSERWQTNYQNHFYWCMGPEGGNAAGENGARVKGLRDCGGTGSVKARITKASCDKGNKRCTVSAAGLVPNQIATVHVMDDAFISTLFQQTASSSGTLDDFTFPLECRSGFRLHFVASSQLSNAAFDSDRFTTTCP